MIRNAPLEKVAKARKCPKASASRAQHPIIVLSILFVFSALFIDWPLRIESEASDVGWTNAHLTTKSGSQPVAG